MKKKASKRCNLAQTSFRCIISAHRGSARSHDRLELVSESRQLTGKGGGVLVKARRGSALAVSRGGDPRGVVHLLLLKCCRAGESCGPRGVSEDGVKNGLQTGTNMFLKALKTSSQVHPKALFSQDPWHLM